MVVSGKVASVHDISAVNLIVGWCLFACQVNLSTTSLLVCKSEIMPSILSATSTKNFLHTDKLSVLP